MLATYRGSNSPASLWSPSWRWVSFQLARDGCPSAKTNLVGMNVSASGVEPFEAADAHQTEDVEHKAQHQ